MRRRTKARSSQTIPSTFRAIHPIPSLTETDCSGNQNQPGPATMSTDRGSHLLGREELLLEDHFVGKRSRNFGSDDDGSSAGDPRKASTFAGPGRIRRLSFPVAVAAAVAAAILLAGYVPVASAAPLAETNHNWHSSNGGSCYYMFTHYQEGERIVTNEPCLNCTCHNSMLMCFLKVCPYTKPLGTNCVVETDPNECCPRITCPEVPVPLMTMAVAQRTTTTIAPGTSLDGYDGIHGCEIHDQYYADGAQVPSDPENPCDLCYCIRNQTACVKQECLLSVDGCRPIYQEGVCCPVRYVCAERHNLLLEELTTTTMVPGVTLAAGKKSGCVHNGEFYVDGSSIPSRDPCDHCYCMMGQVTCAKQDCPMPLDNVANCTAVPRKQGDCCPNKYECASLKIPAGSLQSDEQSADLIFATTTSAVDKPEATSTDSYAFNESDFTADAGLDLFTNTEKSHEISESSTESPASVHEEVVTTEKIEQLDVIQRLQPAADSPAPGSAIVEDEAEESPNGASDGLPAVEPNYLEDTRGQRTTTLGPEPTTAHENEGKLESHTEGLSHAGSVLEEEKILTESPNHNPASTATSVATVKEPEPTEKFVSDFVAPIHSSNVDQAESQFDEPDEHRFEAAERLTTSENPEPESTTTSSPQIETEPANQSSIAGPREPVISAVAAFDKHKEVVTTEKSHETTPYGANEEAVTTEQKVLADKTTTLKPSAPLETDSSTIRNPDETTTDAAVVEPEEASFTEPKQEELETLQNDEVGESEFGDLETAVEDLPLVKDEPDSASEADSTQKFSGNPETTTIALKQDFQTTTADDQEAPSSGDLQQNEISDGREEETKQQPTTILIAREKTTQPPESATTTFSPEQNLIGAAEKAKETKIPESEAESVNSVLLDQEKDISNEAEPAKEATTVFSSSENSEGPELLQEEELAKEATTISIPIGNPEVPEIPQQEVDANTQNDGGDVQSSPENSKLEEAEIKLEQEPSPASTTPTSSIDESSQYPSIIGEQGHASSEGSLNTHQERIPNEDEETSTPSLRLKTHEPKIEQNASLTPTETTPSEERDPTTAPTIESLPIESLVQHDDISAAHEHVKEALIDLQNLVLNQQQDDDTFDDHGDFNSHAVDGESDQSEAVQDEPAESDAQEQQQFWPGLHQAAVNVLQNLGLLAQDDSSPPKSSEQKETGSENEIPTDGKLDSLTEVKINQNPEDPPSLPTTAEPFGRIEENSRMTEKSFTTVPEPQTTEEVQSSHLVQDIQKPSAAGTGEISTTERILEEEVKEDQTLADEKIEQDDVETDMVQNTSPEEAAIEELEDEKKSTTVRTLENYQAPDSSTTESLKTAEADVQTTVKSVQTSTESEITESPTTAAQNTNVVMALTEAEIAGQVKTTQEDEKKQITTGQPELEKVEDVSAPTTQSAVAVSSSQDKPSEDEVDKILENVLQDDYSDDPALSFNSDLEDQGTQEDGAKDTSTTTSGSETLKDSETKDKAAVAAITSESSQQPSFTTIPSNSFDGPSPTSVPQTESQDTSSVDLDDVSQSAATPVPQESSQTTISVSVTTETSQEPSEDSLTTAGKPFVETEQQLDKEKPLDKDLQKTTLEPEISTEHQFKMPESLAQVLHSESEKDALNLVEQDQPTVIKEDEVQQSLSENAEPAIISDDAEADEIPSLTFDAGLENEVIRPSHLDHEVKILEDSAEADSTLLPTTSTTAQATESKYEAPATTESEMPAIASKQEKIEDKLSEDFSHLLEAVESAFLAEDLKTTTSSPSLKEENVFEKDATTGAAAEVTPTAQEKGSTDLPQTTQTPKEVELTTKLVPGDFEFKQPEEFDLTTSPKTKPVEFIDEGLPVEPVEPAQAFQEQKPAAIPGVAQDEPADKDTPQFSTTIKSRPEEIPTEGAVLEVSEKENFVSGTDEQTTAAESSLITTQKQIEDPKISGPSEANFGDAVQTTEETRVTALNEDIVSTTQAAVAAESQDLPHTEGDKIPDTSSSSEETTTATSERAKEFEATQPSIALSDDPQESGNVAEDLQEVVNQGSADQNSTTSPLIGQEELGKDREVTTTEYTQVTDEKEVAVPEKEEATSKLPETPDAAQDVQTAKISTATVDLTTNRPQGGDSLIPVNPEIEDSSFKTTVASVTTLFQDEISEDVEGHGLPGETNQLFHTDEASKDNVGDFFDDSPGNEDPLVEVEQDAAFPTQTDGTGPSGTTTHQSWPLVESTTSAREDLTTTNNVERLNENKEDESKVDKENEFDQLTTTPVTVPEAEDQQKIAENPQKIADEDQQKIPEYQQRIPEDQQKIPEDQQKITENQQQIPEDQQQIPEDQQNIPEDLQKTTSAEESIPPKGSSADFPTNQDAPQEVDGPTTTKNIPEEPTESPLTPANPFPANLDVAPVPESFQAPSNDEVSNDQSQSDVDELLQLMQNLIDSEAAEHDVAPKPERNAHQQIVAKVQPQVGQVQQQQPLADKAGEIHLKPSDPVDKEAHDGHKIKPAAAALEINLEDSATTISPGAKEMQTVPPATQTTREDPSEDPTTTTARVFVAEQTVYSKQDEAEPFTTTEKIQQSEQQDDQLDKEVIADKPQAEQGEHFQEYVPVEKEDELSPLKEAKLTTVDAYTTEAPASSEPVEMTSTSAGKAGEAQFEDEETIAAKPAQKEVLVETQATEGVVPAGNALPSTTMAPEPPAQDQSGASDFEQETASSKIETTTVPAVELQPEVSNVQSTGSSLAEAAIMTTSQGPVEEVTTEQAAHSQAAKEEQAQEENKQEGSAPSTEDEKDQQQTTDSPATTLSDILFPTTVRIPANILDMQQMEGGSDALPQPPKEAVEQKEKILDPEKETSEDHGQTDEEIVTLPNKGLVSDSLVLSDDHFDNINDILIGSVPEVIDNQIPDRHQQQDEDEKPVRFGGIIPQPPGESEEIPRQDEPTPTTTQPSAIDQSVAHQPQETEELPGQAPSHLPDMEVSQQTEGPLEVTTDKFIPAEIMPETKQWTSSSATTTPDNKDDATTVSQAQEATPGAEAEIAIQQGDQEWALDEIIKDEAVTDADTEPPSVQQEVRPQPESAPSSGWLSTITQAITNLLPGQVDNEPASLTSTTTTTTTTTPKLPTTEEPASTEPPFTSAGGEDFGGINPDNFFPPSLVHQGMRPEDLFRPSGNFAPSHHEAQQHPLDIALAQEFGSSVCIYKDRIYMSAEQIPRGDPCDFCFCFRGDVICLQQSCPPPVRNCLEEPIAGFCCPRYECSVPKTNKTAEQQARVQARRPLTSTTTTSTQRAPPLALAGAGTGEGCNINGVFYAVGEAIGPASGPCMQCNCGEAGMMDCMPKACQPQPMIRKLVSVPGLPFARRRR